ncbi:unnamed protein product [Aphanomyces euteiches]
MPAEFIEALIRIARKRYSGLYKKTPLSESFCLLIDNQILPYAYQSDADKFRKQVESPGIRCLLVKYLDDMKTLFAKEISFEAFQEAMIAMACYKFPDPYLSIENRFEKFANMYIISIKDLM